MATDWRVDRTDVSRQGFFSDCDESVRRELRDSRARMLIAKNNREEAQHKKKLVILLLLNPSYLILFVLQSLQRNFVVKRRIRR